MRLSVPSRMVPGSPRAACRVFALGLALAALGLASCASDSGGNLATGGTPASGGAGPATGGAGGGTGSGGGSATGGTTGSGGSAGSATGGTNATGGASRTGGALSEGGRPVSGGAAASGGRPAGGGAPGSGGRTATGGRTGDTGGAGGTSATGGAAATGGTSATGGSNAAGGTGASGGSNAAGGTGGSSHAGKWQIMLLGDSITETTCYPKLLSQQLIASGRANFELVGDSLNNQACGTAPNVSTEGHSCYLVSNLTKTVTPVPGCGGTKGSLTELVSWAAKRPEVVLMLFGTNDAWSSIATQTILDAYSRVLRELRAENPDVIFFVGQIPPLNPSGCGSCEANVEALNAKIPPWATAESTARSPVHVVNVWAALPAATYTPSSAYTSDGCHPNPAGSELIADAWFQALVAAGIP